MPIKYEYGSKNMKTYVETILSPEPATALMARNWADCPDEVATAATPPSSAAIRFSNTSYSLFISLKSRTPRCATYDSGISDAGVNITESPEDIFQEWSIQSLTSRSHLNPNRSAACFGRLWVTDGFEEGNKNIHSGIVEDKTGGGIDGYCPCVCSRIRYLTTMKLKSIKFWLSATLKTTVLEPLGNTDKRSIDL